MSKEFRFDYPYIEDFGGTTAVFLDTAPNGKENWTAFNPSIGFSPEKGYAVTVRSSNYRISEYGIPDIVLPAIKNELWFSELDPDLNPVNLRQLEVSGPIDLSQGVEDARLFWKNDSWYVLGVIQRVSSSNRKTRLALFELDVEKNTAVHVKTYESWETSRSEKNWMPVAYGDNANFDYVYSSAGVVKGDYYILNATSDEYINALRGGSCLWPLSDGTYLAITHSTYVKDNVFYDKETNGFAKTQMRTYTHQFVHYDAYGKVAEVSEEFVFDSPSIEFAAGLVGVGEDFVISYGSNDVSANFAVIPKKTVMSLLGPTGEEF